VTMSGGWERCGMEGKGEREMANKEERHL
jgi:hypothetical protein